MIRPERSFPNFVMERCRVCGESSGIWNRPNLLSTLRSASILRVLGFRFFAPRLATYSSLPVVEW